MKPIILFAILAFASCVMPTNEGSGDNAPDHEWSQPDAGVTAKATEHDAYRASASRRCDRMCRWISEPTWGACAPTWHYCYVGCMTTFEQIPWACYWEFDSWLWHEWMAGPVECSHSWAADPPYSPYAESNRRAMWACWWNGGVP